MRRQYTGKQRAEVIALVNGGQATVAEAAARLGVRLSTAYRWARDARSSSLGARPGRRAGGVEAVVTPRFVRVVPSGAVKAAVAVRVGTAEIQVGRGFDAELLRAVVEALGGGGAA